MKRVSLQVSPFTQLPFHMHTKSLENEYHSYGFPPFSFDIFHPNFVRKSALLWTIIPFFHCIQILIDSVFLCFFFPCSNLHYRKEKNLLILIFSMLHHFEFVKKFQGEITRCLVDQKQQKMRASCSE